MKSGKLTRRKLKILQKSFKKMFKAVKQIKNPTIENNIIVHNAKGKTIINKIDKLINIMQWKTTLKINFGKKKMKA